LTANPIQGVKENICDRENIQAGLCGEDELGSFILAPNATDRWKSPIVSTAIHLKEPGNPINYPVAHTGFYCISTYAFSDHDYKAVVAFRNSFGELPAPQIAKLPFYGALTIVYAVIGVFVSSKVRSLRYDHANSD
jgi:hypothetical protein